MNTAPLHIRFWKKVDKRTDVDCWNWIGSKRLGYGLFVMDGRKGKFKIDSAHRVSYMLNIGPISVDLLVLHRCDNPSCVNPKHLFLGTHGDNMKDKANKGRAPSHQGTANGCAKLTEHQVLEIRHLYKMKSLPIDELSYRYKVSKTNIRYIIKRKTWRHI